MKAPDTVSVIIPCFNGAAYLRQALESALSQTRPPLEVIVVDDGSTDDSAAIAASFGEGVRVIRQPNQGESVARNRALAVAAGTHTLFLDADDLLHPGALEQLVGAVAGDPKAVALMGTASFTVDPQAPFLVHQPAVSQFFPRIIGENPGVPHAWLTPTSLIRQVGGFCEPLQYFEDWDLWCQIGLTGARLVPVDFVGAYYRRHSAAQSYQAPTLARRLGFAKVMERLLAGMLKRRELLEAHGLDAFWGGWTALHACRGAAQHGTSLPSWGHNSTPSFAAGRSLSSAAAFPVWCDGWAFGGQRACGTWLSAMNPLVPTTI